MIFNKEAMLSIFLEQDPVLRSPYARYGNPPMWKVCEFNDGKIMYARPSKTQTSDGFHGYKTVEGVSYQYQQDGKWIGQGCSCTFEHIEKYLANRIENIKIELIKASPIKERIEKCLQ